jgi:hypothetical protein
LNDLLKHNTNTNRTTKGKGTMLICPLGLEQFDQKVSGKLAYPHLGWLEGSYGTNEGTQNKIQTTSKWN